MKLKNLFYALHFLILYCLMWGVGVVLSTALKAVEFVKKNTKRKNEK
jgi:hypothetical protein